MKKILIGLVAVFSIIFIKHSEASTSLMLIKETASFISVSKIMSKVITEPSCGIKGCEYPGDHDTKHENQLYPRPYLWDSAQERYREATKEETAAIDAKTEVNFPVHEEAQQEENQQEQEEGEPEVEEEKSEKDEIDDFFKDTYGDEEDEENKQEQEENEQEQERREQERKEQEQE